MKATKQNSTRWQQCDIAVESLSPLVMSAKQSGMAGRKLGPGLCDPRQEWGANIERHPEEKRILKQARNWTCGWLSGDDIDWSPESVKGA
jgi:hypothetical protein